MIPISVCIIAKNEEKRIGRCLESLLPYGFEIVIVDTGSTDRTKEIASKYTSCIYDFEWVNDFSAARNFSLEKASNNWIFMMDCDEWIESIDMEEFTYFRKHYSHAVGSVTRQNLTGSPEHHILTFDQTERLFNKKHFHYTRKIHEQLTPKVGKDFEAILLNTTIGHDGYLMTEAEKEIKSHRNISLLKEELAQEPDNPYILYQLGKGCDMIADFDNAIEYYAKALSYDLDPTLAYVQSLVISYGEDLLKTNQSARALELQQYLDSITDSADYLYIMGIIFVKNELYENALNCFEKATTFECAHKQGANSFLSFFEIGRILTMISEWKLARNYFEMCGNFDPALQAIKILDQNHV